MQARITLCVYIISNALKKLNKHAKKYGDGGLRCKYFNPSFINLQTMHFKLSSLIKKAWFNIVFYELVFSSVFSRYSMDGICIWQLWIMVYSIKIHVVTAQRSWHNFRSWKCNFHQVRAIRFYITTCS